MGQECARLVFRVMMRLELLFPQLSEDQNIKIGLWEWDRKNPILANKL
jgi:hypothetical protein